MGIGENQGCEGEAVSKPPKNPNFHEITDEKGDKERLKATTV